MPTFTRCWAQAGTEAQTETEGRPKTLDGEKKKRRTEKRVFFLRIGGQRQLHNARATKIYERGKYIHRSVDGELGSSGRETKSHEKKKNIKKEDPKKKPVRKKQAKHSGSLRRTSGEQKRKKKE